MVTGGLGYIGRHVVQELIANGETVVSVDQKSLQNQLWNPNSFTHLAIDLKEIEKNVWIFEKYNVGSVIHLAGAHAVNSSFADPMGFYISNSGLSARLLRASFHGGVKRFLFASSASVYSAKSGSLEESDPTGPIHPYGRTKLISEWQIADAARAYKFKYGILRLFNVAGYDPETPFFYDQNRPNHLIEELCASVLEKREFKLIAPIDNGGQMPFRDYVHVKDVATAFSNCLRKLSEPKSESLTLNVGTGQAYTAIEIIRRFEVLTGRKIKIQIENSELPSQTSLVANPHKCAREIGFRSSYSIDEILLSSWRVASEERGVLDPQALDLI